MGRSKSKNKGRRTRRKFTPEFKADVVRLCRTGTESIGEVLAIVERWADEGEVDAVLLADAPRWRTIEGAVATKQDRPIVLLQARQ